MESARLRIARLDRRLRSLLARGWGWSTPAEVDRLLDQRLLLMTERDQGFVVRDRRRLLS